MCIEAWADLGTCRSFGLGVGPIPWTAIVAWAKSERLDRDLRKLLVAVIRRLDRDFLEAQASKNSLK